MIPNDVKKEKILVLTDIILLILIAGMLPVFAQTAGPTNPNANVTTAYSILHSNQTISTTNSHPVTVSTDKQSYVTNDMITITGVGDPNLTTTQYLAGISTPVVSKIPIAMRIFDSAGNIEGIKQFYLDDTGKYSVTILASDNWKNPGLYTIVAQQGTNNKTQTQFWFNYNGGPIPDQQPSHTTTISPPSTTLPITPSTSPTLSPSPVNSTSIPTMPSKIPNWVKGVFNFYAQGNLSDDDLIKALQFLIQQGIIKLS